MGMFVKEVANLVGISVRTLHHYDDIGLLSPDQTSEAGYRLYSNENLEMLQQILFFKELGFPLKKIKEIITDPTFNKREALELHREMLLDKRKRLDTMIATLNKTIKHTKGEIFMSNKEKFEGFNFNSNPFEEEARKRYGDQAIDESNKKIGRMSPTEQKELGESMNNIYRKLANLRHESPDTKKSQAAIEEWYHLLNKMGSYSLEAFKGLGQLYVDDERFTKNIDQFGEGLSIFMSKAMAFYADSRMKE
ncbi:MerR family transcriptional regulator [Bacillus suaedaesalsae]|uniref:MerR family transcriptional regulator n=1 Tax=Bacillus suaedaesalsae TaxID=2810349 RepID=A0ABS2DL81_9BACI|nr:MerR family transcriptional regulator [Bacillus suaedaesalsae]MBM6619249.1 MerR family transcriptional regulator [Bacillus suaedaesalsae]